MLVMVGVTLLTVTSTAMFCDLVVTLAPEATTVILPVYGAICGARVVASTVTVRITCSPGKTIPTVGDTVIHADPAVAENEMGELSVVKVTVCATDGSGGAVKIRVPGFKVKVEGGDVTLRVTVTTAGEATPATVMVTEEL